MSQQLRPLCDLKLDFRKAEGSRFTILAEIIVLGMFCLVVLPQASGHAPLMPGGNDSLATATIVSDPTKSWAIYSELHEGGEAHYYRFDIVEGQKIRLSLLKSTSPEEGDFLPGFVLMGSKLTSKGTLPSYVEMPEGASSIVIEGKTPARGTYEAFSPSAFYRLGDLDLNAPSSGTYYIAIYEDSRGGHYGLAIGDRESFTLSEWVLAPLSFVAIYQWGGQSLPVVLTPAAIVLLIGVTFLVLRRRFSGAPRTPFQWAGALAGLLFVASGVTVICQMIFALRIAPAASEAIVTSVLGLAPIVMGVLAAQFAVRGPANARTRVSLVILGFLALFAWAGFLVGPMIAILCAVLPNPKERLQSATKARV